MPTHQGRTLISASDFRAGTARQVVPVMVATPRAVACPTPLISDAQQCDKQPERLKSFIFGQVNDLRELSSQLAASDQHGRSVSRPDASAANALLGVIAGRASLCAERSELP